MRNFFQSHWKVIVAIILAIVLALTTVETDSARAAPPLTARLHAHVAAIAAERHDTAMPREPEQAARHIEGALDGFGYTVRRQEYEAGGRRVRNVEASLANLAPGARPERIFIIGAHFDATPGAGENGSGAAAVLELARLLRDMRPGQGTEVKFVFFVNEEAPWFLGEDMGGLLPGRTGQPPPELEARYPDAGDFIAFVGTLESSALVRQALAAFKAGADFPAQGLAAQAHVMGVTLSGHGPDERQGYPALMITDTAFLRYPYHHTAGGAPEKPDFDGMSRVVRGLARTIAALASPVRS
ncbi:M28 family peptidase [Massilia niastensis]|uniref:M28 family peptidase n=1 Tax=Massilia niastensis TaxID=544911 RepID=UPI0003699345|nr:M28 family peptidase [Massilia niastensis]